METYLLEECCEILDSRRVPITKENRAKGQYPYYGANGIQDYVDDYIFDDDLVLLAEDGGNFGSKIKPIAYRVSGKCWVNNHAHVLKAKEIVDVDYLCYSLMFYNVEDMINGATRQKLTQTQMKKMEIPKRNLFEQKKIVNILQGIQNVIALKNNQLQKLNNLIQGRFVEMFGECKSNPKGWNIRKLDEISDVSSSKRVFVDELKNKGIPFYRGTEVGAFAEGKKIVPELFITTQHYEELCKASGTPQKGDLLMPSICPDGRIWLVDTDEPFYFKDGRVLWVHNIDDQYNPVFLLYTLKDRIMTDYANLASGTTFAELKIFALKACRVFEVPLLMQRRFADFVTQVDKSKVVIQKSIDKLQLLFDSLMQQYFG